MRICYFGTYDAHFAKNKFILRALELNDVEVIKIHRQVPVTDLNKKRHVSPWLLAKRLFVKFSILPISFHHWQAIKSCDAILVGYPGHMDVPFAAIISRLSGVPMFFDPVLILAKTFTESVPMITQGSFIYRCIVFAESVIYKIPKLIFTETEYTKTMLQEMFGIPDEKIKVLYLGADDAIYKKKSGIGGKTLIVTYYGMYIKIHGVPVIVEAATLLKDEPGITFQLIGRGPLYEETAKAVAERGLTNVDLLPNVTEANAFPYLAKGSVFLGFLTDSDLVQRTIPNKVYQGMAMGQVVLTAGTKVAKLHFKDRENAMLVEPDDARAVARALLWLYKNPKETKEIAERGYERFVTNYSPKAIGATLVTYVKSYSKRSV